MKKVLLVLIAIVLMGLTACSQSVLAEILQSEKRRVTEPEVSQDDLATLVDGNSEFAFDLYQVLKEAEITCLIFQYDGGNKTSEYLIKERFYAKLSGGPKCTIDRTFTLTFSLSEATG